MHLYNKVSEQQKYRMLKQYKPLQQQISQNRKVNASKGVKHIKKLKNNMFVKKAYRQVQVAQKIIFNNMRTYKGSRKDTNLLNINFKTIISQVLEPLYTMRQVSSVEMKAIQRYRQSPPSFTSLIQLIYKRKDIQQPLNKQFSNGKLFFPLQFTNSSTQFSIQSDQYLIKSPKILKRLKELFQSDQILLKIFHNDGSFVNKLLMLKFLQAIRYTIVGNGCIVKWKDLKKVAVLK